MVKLLLVVVFLALLSYYQVECQTYILQYKIYRSTPYADQTQYCRGQIYLLYNASLVTTTNGIEIDRNDDLLLMKVDYFVPLGTNNVPISYTKTIGGEDTTSITVTCQYADNDLFTGFSLINPGGILNLEFKHDTLIDRFYLYNPIDDIKISNSIFSAIELTTSTGYNLVPGRVVANRYFEITIDINLFPTFYKSITAKLELYNSAEFGFDVNIFPSLVSSPAPNLLSSVSLGSTIDSPFIYYSTITNIQAQTVFLISKPDTSNNMRSLPIYNPTPTTVVQQSHYNSDLGGSFQLFMRTVSEDSIDSSPQGFQLPITNPLLTLTEANSSTYSKVAGKKIVDLGFYPTGIFSFGGLQSFSVESAKFLFPIGMSGHSPQNIELYWINLMYSSYSRSDLTAIISNMLVISVLFPNNSLVDIEPPKLHDAVLTHIQGYDYLITLTVSDNLSGVHHIIVMGDILLKKEDIASGTTTNGVFEKIIQITRVDSISNYFSIILADVVGNISPQYLEGMYLSVNLNTVPGNPLNNIKNTLVSVFFTLPTVNVSRGDYISNSIFIEISNVSYCSEFPVTFKPQFQFIDSNPIEPQPFFTGVFNKTLGKYVINFEIPGKLMTKSVNYEINVAGQIYTSDLLKELFPLTSILNVYSSVGNEMPPTIQMITAILNLSQGLIGYTMSLLEANPFSHGTFSIISDYDKHPRNFTISQDDLDVNNIFNLTFTIDTTICMNQTFKLASAKLVDIYGHTSYYDTYDISSTYRFGVFSRSVLGGPETSNPVVPEIPIECSEPLTYDISIAEYKNAMKLNTTTNSLNVAVVNKFEITFSALSTYNISTRHLPVVLLQEVNNNYIQVTSEITSNTINNLGTHIMTYVARVVLPIGFGLEEGILISIYNIADIYSRSSMISAKFLDSYVNTYWGTPESLITKTSDITSDGGQLTIFGNGFGLPSAQNSKVYMYYGTNTSVKISLDVVFYSSVLIVVDAPATETKYSLYVSPEIATQSNVVFIIPISEPKPTISPQIQCFGTPLCGGPNNGECTDNGCICKGNWIGKDCLSQQIIITKPNVSITNPSSETNVNGTLPNGEQVSFKNLISIVSLIEYDFKNTLIQNFTFTEWLFTNTSTTTSTAFQYFTQINNNSTNVTVSLEWFEKESIINFANQDIKMLPSTMKYTIEITAYQFHSPTNTLQLVINAQILSDNKESTCVTRTTSNDNSNDSTSDYFKLQIDDHSLYGRFIKRALLDYRPTSISNTLLNSSTTGKETSQLESQQLIGINIPYFRSNVVIDPDFSVLIESNKGIDDSGCSSPSKGLTKAQLAGIIIASSIVGLVLILFIVYLILKKTNSAVEVQYKLRKLASPKV